MCGRESSLIGVSWSWEKDDNMDEDPNSRYYKLLNVFYKDFGEWDKALQYSDHINLTAKWAKEFASMGIRYLFWINGGALIALPAIVEAFEIETGGLVYVAACYAAGLFWAVICSLFAYFMCYKLSQHVVSQKYREFSSFLLRHLREFYEPSDIKDIEKKIEEYKDEENKNGCFATGFEIAALVTTLLSLACFIVGSLLFINHL
jgi:hypothetical protein